MSTATLHEVRLNDYTLCLDADDPLVSDVHVIGPIEQVCGEIAGEYRELVTTREGRRLVWELLTTTRADVRDEDADELADRLGVPTSCPE